VLGEIEKIENLGPQAQSGSFERIGPEKSKEEGKRKSWVWGKLRKVRNWTEANQKKKKSTLSPYKEGGRKKLREAVDLAKKKTAQVKEKEPCKNQKGKRGGGGGGRPTHGRWPSAKLRTLIGLWKGYGFENCNLHNLGPPNQKKRSGLAV